MIAYLLVFFFILAQSTELAEASANRNKKLAAKLRRKEAAEKLEYTMIFTGKCPAGSEIINAAQCEVAAKRFKTDSTPWVYRRKRSSESKTGGCYGKSKNYGAFFCTEKRSPSSPAQRMEASESYPYFCIMKPGCDESGCTGCKSYNWEGFDLVLELGEKCEYDEKVGACTTDSFVCSESIGDYTEVASNTSSSKINMSMVINVLLALNLVFMCVLAYTRRKKASQVVPLLESEC